MTQKQKIADLVKTAMVGYQNYQEQNQACIDSQPFTEERSKAESGRDVWEDITQNALNELHKLGVHVPIGL